MVSLLLKLSLWSNSYSWTQTSTNFYMLLLTFEIMFMCMFCLVCFAHIYIQYQGIIKSRPGIHVRMTQAEKKMLFLFIYYVILGGITLMVFASDTSDINLLDHILAYMECQAFGYSKNSTQYMKCQKKLNKSDLSKFNIFNVLTPLQYIMIGTVPIIIMIIGVNWKLTLRSVKRSYWTIHYKVRMFCCW